MTSIYEVNIVTKPKEWDNLKKDVQSLLDGNPDMIFYVNLLLSEPDLSDKTEYILIKGEYGITSVIISNLVNNNENLKLNLENIDNFIRVRNTLICQEEMVGL